MPRSTSALIAATAVVLAIGSTGGAVAGSLITSSQIKNNTIISADIKNKSIKRKDLARSALRRVGAEGPAGPRGPAGETGAPGPRGLSASDPLPSGKAITGAFGVHVTSAGEGIPRSAVVSLAGRTAEPLTVDQVNFAPSDIASVSITDRDSACVGTLEAPTAPAGKVCIYLASVDNVATLRGNNLSYGATTNFVIRYQPRDDLQGASVLVAGSWAYTAP